MRVVKVTGKLQVTIPKDLAEIAGISVGDLVTIELAQNDSLIIRKLKDLEKAAEIEISVGDSVTVKFRQDGSVMMKKLVLLEELAGALNPGRKVEHLAEELDQERKAAERQSPL